MLRVGAILRGIYRIDSYLSSGGFGNTYVATNIEFDERVAIKEFFMKGVTQREDNQTTVSVSNTDNKDSFMAQREKFKKEARRIRQLRNPHIVNVHDLFEENGTAYYVMDYVDGENLSERLKRTGKPMTEQEVRDILPQILDALKSVHDAGIWHLDLKPANIMLEKSGNIKLIDFGASKQMDAQKGGATTSTAISYTNGYAPREQMEQNYDKFGPWTDIYALGATLYNLLTNKRPPLPTDIDDDMSEDKHLALPFPEGVSDGMKNCVLWMMKTNRLQRPQSIDAIIIAEKERKDTPKPSKAPYSSTPKVTPVDEGTIIAEPLPKRGGRKTPTNPPVPQPTIEEKSETLGNLSEESKKSNGFIIIGVCVFIAILAVLLYASYIFSSQSNTETEVQASQDNIVDVDTRSANEVVKMRYQSALGYCEYSGPVDDSNIPNGIGEAIFKHGYYKGNFEHGVLTGENSFFKYSNGDTFEGEFRNNAFFYGRYTVVDQDYNYFVGYYKNGQPHNGTWYDKNGKVIEVYTK